MLVRCPDGSTAAGAAITVGIGTALVYPSLLAAVPDVTPGVGRGAAMGSYRLLRDSGYVVGALAAGPMADAVGIPLTLAALATVMGLAIVPAFALPGRGHAT